MDLGTCWYREIKWNFSWMEDFDCIKVLFSSTKSIVSVSLFLQKQTSVRFSCIAPSVQWPRDSTQFAKGPEFLARLHFWRLPKTFLEPPFCTFVPCCCLQNTKWIFQMKQFWLHHRYLLKRPVLIQRDKLLIQVFACYWNNRPASQYPCTENLHGLSKESYYSWDYPYGYN